MAYTPPILKETGPTQRQIDLAKAAQLQRGELQRQAPIIPSIPQPTINQPVVNPMPAGYDYYQGGPGKSYFGQQALNDFYNTKSNYLNKDRFRLAEAGQALWRRELRPRRGARST